MILLYHSNVGDPFIYKVKGCVEGTCPLQQSHLLEGIPSIHMTKGCLEETQLFQQTQPLGGIPPHN